jgi:hypothetical protein
MKKLATIAVVSIAMYGCASSPASQTFGPYNVTGVGNTCNEARDNAFRIAVEQSFGTAVMAERQSKHDVLTRDEIVSHSSGFIDEYKILNTVNNSSGCTIKMTATVSPSMVNKYIFNDASDSNPANGDKVNTKINTFLDAKNRSDATLDGLFIDYVKRAYKVKQESVKYETDSFRNTSMVVTYEVSMNSDFLKALDYTLAKLEDKCSGNCSRTPKFNLKYIPDGSIIPKMPHYFFADMQTPTKVNDLLIGECTYPWYVQINVYGSGDRLLYSELKIPYKKVPDVYTESNGWGKELNAMVWDYRGQTYIPMNKFSAGDMKRIDIQLVDNTKKINGKCM